MTPAAVARMVDLYQLKNREYALAGTFVGDAVVEAQALPGFRVLLKELF